MILLDIFFKGIQLNGQSVKHFFWCKCYAESFVGKLLMFKYFMHSRIVDKRKLNQFFPELNSSMQAVYPMFQEEIDGIPVIIFSGIFCEPAKAERMDTKDELVIAFLGYV